MKAVVYSALGRVGIDSIDARDPGPGEALVRTKASGICHTDIEILRGRYGTGAFPVVPGHEYAGVVEATGPGVTEVTVGDRVVVDPNIGCGTCRYCRRGMVNLCADLGAYGVTRNGGFAENSTVAVTNLVRIGDLPFDLAALAEPVGCVLNGVEAIGTEGVAQALVFGAGPIGMLMALALRSRGVGSVGLVDIDDDRLAFADSFGFAALASGSDALSGLEHEVDLAVDATGVPAVAAGLPGYVANGGKVLYFGVCPPDARIELSPFEVFRRQLTIAGTHSLNHNIPAALETIDAIGADLGRIVSHRLPIEEIPKFLGGEGMKKTLKVQSVF
jgi:threonine dehydrogenase-like Zn-dependent dehydrogenase